MKMSEQDISLVASMLTDDPDLLVNEDKALNEWGAARGTAAAPGAPPPGAGQKPVHVEVPPQIDELFGVRSATEAADIRMEFTSFVRYQPSLASDPQAALKAFVKYKKTGQMPNPRDSAQLDNMSDYGYGDFRHR